MPRILILGEHPAPVTYRIGGDAYVHRWWRLEPAYRVFESDVEFESTAYYLALHEYNIDRVIVLEGPLYSDFFEALRTPIWGHQGGANALNLGWE